MPKRFIALAVVISVLMSCALGRCAYVTFGDTYKVDSTYNSISVEISSLYTNIYSRNGVRLNNNSTALKAVIKPNERSLSELEKLFSPDEIKQITKELSDGKPVVKSIKKYAKTDYIRLFETTSDDTQAMLARHMLDKSCGGLEKYVSKKIGSLSVNYSVSALGKVLDGDDGTVADNNYSSTEGIKISIDEGIQKIAETSAKTLKKGALVILNVSSSQILASVSTGGDYLNRAACPYAVGSVFKLVVAIAALENNINPEYTCKSKINIGGVSFHCQNNHKHGRQNRHRSKRNLRRWKRAS